MPHESELPGGAEAFSKGSPSTLRPMVVVSLDTVPRCHSNVTKVFESPPLQVTLASTPPVVSLVGSMIPAAGLAAPNVVDVRTSAISAAHGDRERGREVTVGCLLCDDH